MTEVMQMNWVEAKPDVATRTKVHLSWNDRQDELLRTILTLYNEGQEIDLDACYSIGALWDNLPTPRLKFDIDPQVAGCEAGDCRNLPLADESVSSAFLDLPFLWGRSKTGIMKTRFTKLPTMDALLDLYRDAIAEAYRVLAPKGVLVFKTQNVVSSGRKWPISYRVLAFAEAAGFSYEDDLTLIRHCPMSQEHMYGNGQQHTRSANCLFFVFRKQRLSMTEQRSRARANREYR